MCGRYIVIVLGLVLPIVSGLWSNCQDKEGGGCSLFCQCVPGLQCEAGSQVCRGPAREGESCHLTRHCGDGLQCEAGTHICRGPGEEGDSCHATRPCGRGLQCEAGSHICRGPAQEGEACHLTRLCSDGLVCEPLIFVCQRKGKVGDECKPRGMGSEDMECSSATRNWCDPISKTCVPPSRKGEPCGSWAMNEDFGVCDSRNCVCGKTCTPKDDVKKAKDIRAYSIKNAHDKGMKFCCKCV